MDNFEQMDLWALQAEKALQAMNDEKPKNKQPRTSFFNDQPGAADCMDLKGDNLGDFNDQESWNDIYRRALEVDFSDDDGLLNEVDRVDPYKDGMDPRDGFGGKQVGKDGFSYPNQLITPSSVGPDAGRECGPNRVTQDFNQGDYVNLVDELKHKIFDMEREAAIADIQNDRKKRESLIKQLKGLRQEVYDISEKMQSKPERDVT